MSLTKYDGGTAYPFGLNYPGLSIRDWFAGQALAGLAANMTLRDYEHDIALRAYTIANAMIKQKQELEKEEIGSE